MVTRSSPSFLINALNELAANAGLKSAAVTGLPLLDIQNIIARENRARYAAQIADIFSRLVYDERTAGIYGELLKLTRPNRNQFHEAQPLWINTMLQYDVTPHEKAIIGLLLTAAHLVVDPPRVISKRWQAEMSDHERDELYEHEIRHGSAVVLTKANAKRAAQTAFLRKLVDETYAVFGKPLHGIVATIANVALNRNDITFNTVRKSIPKPIKDR